MARNLSKAGFQVVVWNRTRSKAQALVPDGIVVADSPAEVARAAQVVVTMVTDTAALQEVVEGPQGVAEGMAPGSVLVDMSSVSPSVTREMAARLAQRGVAMLDAPVSGGSWGAQQGTLTIMVGGERKVYERCMSIFQAMGQRITLMGANGMGQTTKLVNQVLVAGTSATVAEALVFAAAQGADLDQTIEAVAQGAAGSWQLQNLGPRMVQGDYAPGFMVRLQLKDLRLVLEAAQEHHVPLPITSLVHRLFASLEAEGLGEEGTQAIVKVLQKLSGIEAPQTSASADTT